MLKYSVALLVSALQLTTLSPLISHHSSCLAPASLTCTQNNIYAALTD